MCESQHLYFQLQSRRAIVASSNSIVVHVKLIRRHDDVLNKATAQGRNGTIKTIGNAVPASSATPKDSV